MKKQILIFALLIFTINGFSFAKNDIPTVTGEISEVIVYRGQALVTRVIELDLSKGGSEIVVEKLPLKIISESLYAQVSDGAVVSSVRYREKAVREDTRQEVKELNLKIEQVHTKIRHAEGQLSEIGNNVNSLAKLQNFTVSAENADLNRGLLQFEPLEKLFNYVQTERSELYERKTKLDDELIEFIKQRDLLQRKLNDLRAGRSRTERQAVLYINNPTDSRVLIQLRYLVNEANWLPQYNMRGKPDESRVMVEYNAVIHQSSGEDWNKVALSLSTAQPTMIAGSPALEAMEVDISKAFTGGRGVRSKVAVQEQVSDRMAGVRYEYRDLGDEFKKLQTSRRNMASKGKTAQIALNEVSFSNQIMELRADKDAIKVIKKEAKKYARTESVSVTYKMPGKLSMPSRSDQQLLTIAAFESKADFLMIATPLLTDYVYLQADILNDSDVIMLAGPLSVYRNGEFAGKSSLELVTIGEKFTVGFGVDSQVQILREFGDKKVETLWGNTIEKYEYRIEINNYKNNPVKLRLLERIPYTQNEDLLISGFLTNTDLSADQEYQRVDKKKGILRWDLKLDPMTTGQKAKIITYGYSMKYDKEMTICTVPK